MSHSTEPSGSSNLLGLMLFFDTRLHQYLKSASGSSLQSRGGGGGNLTLLPVLPSYVILCKLPNFSAQLFLQLPYGDDNGICLSVVVRIK